MGLTKDQRIGRNLATLRGTLSQQALGDAMRRRGYKWSQATVWSVETGDRPLRLSEAEDLAEILNVRLHFFAEVTPAGMALDSTLDALGDAYEDAVTKVAAYVQMRGQLVVDLQGIATGDQPDVPDQDQVADINRWLGEARAPERLLEEAATRVGEKRLAELDVGQRDSAVRELAAEQDRLRLAVLDALTARDPRET